MKTLIVSTLLVFLAGCSSMGASFGSSMGGRRIMALVALMTKVFFTPMIRRISNLTA
jgi:hypothetical protein